MMLWPLYTFLSALQSFFHMFSVLCKYWKALSNLQSYHLFLSSDSDIQPAFLLRLQAALTCHATLFPCFPEPQKYSYPLLLLPGLYPAAPFPYPLFSLFLLSVQKAEVLFLLFPLSLYILPELSPVLSVFSVPPESFPLLLPSAQEVFRSEFQMLCGLFPHLPVPLSRNHKRFLSPRHPTHCLQVFPYFPSQKTVSYIPPVLLLSVFFE